MNLDLWRRIVPIIEAALAVRGAQRERLIDDRCGGDEPMRRVVWSMIEAHDQATRPHDSETMTLPVTRGVLTEGLAIDGYVIRRLIGEGAFGQVYLAEQLRPVRRSRVAIKVIKPGMDTRQMLARFEAEKQTLAMMSHPSIAKVLGAGMSAGGRPYFVMEYIKGVPLIEHCDRHALGIDERLRLFISICDAVQHAHQRGIIHRDIKPSNILVSYEEGPSTPKIIDFGVAKALARPLADGLSSYAEDGRIIGTPQYMAPEQIDPTRQDVDTRSDIYSLGVLLYELLVAARPFDRSALLAHGVGDLPAAVRDLVPTRPSRRLGSLAEGEAEATARTRATDAKALRHRLRGDLDRITMMCLEKDRARRYESALELARDVERHLRNEPVRAVPPSVAYRTAKFVARHRAALLVAAAMVLLAFAAAALALRSLRVERARARAEAALVPGLVERARIVAYHDPAESRRLLDQAAASDPRSPGPPIERARLAQLGPDEEAALAEAQDVVRRFPDSGEAAALLAGALAGRDPEQGQRTRERAEALLSREERRPNEARARLLSALAFGERDGTKAVRLFSDSLALDPWNFETLWQRAVRQYELAHERLELEDVDGALAAFDAGLADAELMTKVREDLAMTWIQRGAVLLSRGTLLATRAAGLPAEDPERARQEQRSGADMDLARASFDRALELEPDNWLGLYNRALWHGRRAEGYGGRPDGGELERGLVDLEQAIGHSPVERRLFAEKGRFCYRLGRYEDAVAAATRAIELGDLEWRTREDRGTARVKTRDFAGAAEDFGAALAAAAGKREVSDLVRARMLAFQSEALRNVGRHEEARAAAQQAITLDPGSAHAHLVLGKALLRLQPGPQAAMHFERAVELNPANPTYRLERGVAYRMLGEDEPALSDLIAYARQEGDPWIWLWVWEIEQLRGRAPEAASALAAARLSEQPLLLRVLSSLDGQVEPGAVIAPDETRENRVAATYALGIVAFAKGRSAEAADWFRKCQQLGLTDWMEHDLAGWHLERLEG